MKSTARTPGKAILANSHIWASWRIKSYFTWKFSPHPRFRPPLRPRRTDVNGWYEALSRSAAACSNSRLRAWVYICFSSLLSNLPAHPAPWPRIRPPPRRRAGTRAPHGRIWSHSSSCQTAVRGRHAINDFLDRLDDALGVMPWVLFRQPVSDAGARSRRWSLH